MCVSSENQIDIFQYDEWISLSHSKLYLVCMYKGGGGKRRDPPKKKPNKKKTLTCMASKTVSPEPLFISK